MSPQRPMIDWEEAFAYYATLDPTVRALRLVAERFGISLKTVKRRSSELGWSARLKEIEAQAREQANGMIVRDRAVRIQESIVMIDRARLRFLEQLNDPEYKLSGNEMAALMRHESLLEGEATDRVSEGEIEGRLRRNLEIALRFIDPARTREFLAAIRADALGELPAGPDPEAEAEAGPGVVEGEEETS